MTIEDVKNIQRMINNVLGEGAVEVDGAFGHYTRTQLKRANKMLHTMMNNTSEVSGFKFGDASLKRLEGVHPDIVECVTLALQYSEVDFVIADGLRTQAMQDQLVRMGKSQSRNSYHVWGLAVDLVPYIDGKIRWNDLGGYKKIHDAIKMAEDIMGKNVLDSAMFDLHWSSLIDYPHYQMHPIKGQDARKVYKYNRYKGF